MTATKIKIRKKIREYIRRSPFFFIELEDDMIIKKTKEDFIHNDRSFTYGYKRYLTNSLYCHASPGTIESTICELQISKPNGDLLNLGGGTGQVSDIFRKLGYNVYNIDLETPNEKTNDHNMQHDLNSYSPMPTADKKFDIVLCQEIIEHLENPWHLMSQAKEALKPNGLLIISTPNVQSRWSRLKFFITGYLPWFSPGCFNYHINPLFDWEIKLITEKIGLEIVKIKGNGDYYFNRKNTDQKKIIAKNEEIIYFIRIKK